MIVNRSLGLDDLRVRIEEVLWVTEYLADLESDFSAIHGVVDMLSLNGPKWLRMCHRIFAYPGVMQHRAEAINAEGETRPSVNPNRAATTTELTTNSALAGLIEIG